MPPALGLPGSPRCRAAAPGVACSPLPAHQGKAVGTRGRWVSRGLPARLLPRVGVLWERPFVSVSSVAIWAPSDAGVCQERASRCLGVTGLEVISALLLLTFNRKNLFLRRKKKLYFTFLLKKVCNLANNFDFPAQLPSSRVSILQTPRQKSRTPKLVRASAHRRRAHRERLVPRVMTLPSSSAS